MNSKPSITQGMTAGLLKPPTRGSISIEGMIIMPVFLMVMLLVLYGILAQVYFDAFEEAMTRALLDSTTQSLGYQEIRVMVRSYDGLELEAFDLSLTTMTVSLSYQGLFRRRWVVAYDIRLPSFESLLYVTDTGKKYHRFGCRHLSQSMIPMIASEAMVKFSPCGVCSLN